MTDPEATLTLHTRDLHCDGCVRTVSRALYQEPGVHNVTVSVDDGLVHVRHAPAVVSAERLRAAVEDAGYTVAPLGQ